jgi:transcriptional regulator with XRE-family HTH domain
VITENQLVALTQQQIIDRMNRQGVTRTELARRIGRSKTFVTLALKGQRRNVSLVTLSQIAEALDATATITLEDR